MGCDPVRRGWMLCLSIRPGRAEGDVALSGSKEHQLGKGTLGYKGETAEYYESKRGLWDRFRWVLAGVCLVMGVAFLVASASPIVSATVLSVTDNGTGGTSSVVLLAPDGASTTVSISYASTPTVGSTEAAMQLPGGRLVLGDYSSQGRGAGLLFLALGIGIVLMALWRIRHPKPQTTTVLVPDDTYALPPHSS
jgi:hypothetical protein